ncbi:MAG: YndJ family transporter [Candidatus Acidiferrales bacterium]
MNARPLHTRLLLSAAIGGAAWLGLAFLARGFAFDTAIFELMFLLAPLVVTPLALALLANRYAAGIPFTFALACVIQPVAAIGVALSVFFAAGTLAGLLTLPWLAVCALVALTGLTGLRRRKPFTTGALAACAGMMFLAVGGGALTASRSGVGIAGFDEPIILLTAVHFHFTGFATAVLVSALAEAFARDPLPARNPRAVAISAIGLIAATPLLAIGWLLDSAAWKLICVLMLVASLALLAALAFRLAARRGPALARTLLAVSAASVLFGMVLAGLYGAGEFAGYSLIDLHQMARWHGVANGIGFTICGLLALNLEARA